ncbi:hypothetical protein GCM10023264_24880 [Sphingomonas daechungensis]|uniref:Lipocalin family protein n=1 Tax=Sphingomonas daechungensis TaxID=1176646 RepID=A0ABX6T3P4_9SPHN|nr:hypothetical protein [Sphingomonas daechungensis]QNP43527.1 hypothetical protein H9L15_01725 [Sphingomonas daechungensis]
MRLTTSTAIAAALILSLGACKAQESTGNNEAAATAPAGDLSAIDGTWKADLSTLKFEQKPDEFLLKDGKYSCNTCIPPLTAVADGQFHPVADRPYYDSLSIKAVDDKTVEFHRKKGDAEVSTNTLTVSADGNTLTNKFHDATTPNTPIDGSTTLKRAGPAPEGAHAISGQWQPEHIGDYTQDALNTTYKVEGNKVTSSVAGQTYTAEIGGPEVPIANDTGGTTVKVAREGANGLSETFSRGGKVVGIVLTIPSADGKTVAIVSTDPRDGSKSTWTSTKSE